jgi:hypothetical protein
LIVGIYGYTIPTFIDRTADEKKDRKKSRRLGSAASGGFPFRCRPTPASAFLELFAWSCV